MKLDQTMEVIIEEEEIKENEDATTKDDRNVEVSMDSIELDVKQIMGKIGRE